MTCMKSRVITIEITCKTKESYRELEENLDYFVDALDNIAGNVEGFSYSMKTEEVSQKK